MNLIYLSINFSEIYAGDLATMTMVVFITPLLSTAIFSLDITLVSLILTYAL